MQLHLPRDQSDRLKSLLVAAGRREIGGVLMGEQIDIDRFRIVDFSVDDKTGSAAHFVRSAEEHREALDAFFSRTNRDYTRYNYLGEWHSHPSYSTNPSAEDCRSMSNLVGGERSIDFAVLMIVRLRLFRRLDVAAFTFARQQAARRADIERV
jgi:integrative and conjugative element protein (TIGR02256 family)